MNEVKTKYEHGLHLTDVTSSLDIFEHHEKVAQANIKINHPFTYKSLAFTHKNMGFSPKIEVKEKKSGKVLLNSFVMLSTFVNDETTEYRDFLPFEFLKNRTIITVYPDHEMKDGQPVKSSEEPGDPLIRIEIKGDNDKIISTEYLALGENVAIGEHILKFNDLRRWVEFQVVEDPGYLTVCLSLWLGLAALLLRYIPDLQKWSVSAENLKAI
jgi:hypothetical protein